MARKGGEVGDGDATSAAVVSQPASSGFDRLSVILVAVVVVIGGTFGYAFRAYVSVRWEDADPLLWACWLGMLGLAARGASRRDLPLALVGLVGGGLIEAWGTRTGLWTYFTRETPPLFILPAWPMAALATARVAGLLRPRAPLAFRVTRPIYLLVCLLFFVTLLGFVAPSLERRDPLTLAALAAVVFTMATGRDRADDLRLFAAGCLVGFPLEYWGTTRACWVYWLGDTPPLASVLSHGFATVAFARGVWLLGRLLRSFAPSFFLVSPTPSSPQRVLPREVSR
jgi:hypothetical protein